MSEVTLSTRVCSSCLRQLALLNFSIRSDAPHLRRGQCTDCRILKSKLHRTKNKSLLLAKSKTYYQNNKQRVLQRQRTHKRENPERVNEVQRRARLKHKPKAMLRYKNYYAAHKADYAARCRARENQIAIAIPPWVTSQQRRDLNNFYVNCPKGFEVDHIWPLKHNLCFGLHIIQNLQYLPKAANRAKHNKLPTEWSYVGWMKENYTREKNRLKYS